MIGARSIAFVLQSASFARGKITPKSPRHICSFGLSTEFSTPVEKTVEIPQEMTPLSVLGRRYPAIPAHLLRRIFIECSPRLTCNEPLGRNPGANRNQGESS